MSPRPGFSPAVQVAAIFGKAIDKSAGSLDALTTLTTRALGPTPDPDTGADRGSCCAHAYADGWNACVENQTEARAAVAELIAERDRLHALVNNPQTELFLEAVRAEAAHQVERWGTVHDRAKEPQDWFWLLGYLGGKALAPHNSGDEFKALHHTISSAAVLANWFAAIKLGKSGMAPGSSDLQAFIEEQFGSVVLASDSNPTAAAAFADETVEPDSSGRSLLTETGE